MINHRNFQEIYTFVDSNKPGHLNYKESYWLVVQIAVTDTCVALGISCYTVY